MRFLCFFRATELQCDSELQPPALSLVARSTLFACIRLPWHPILRNAVPFVRFSKMNLFANLRNHFGCKSCCHRILSSYLGFWNHVGDLRLRCRHSAADELDHQHLLSTSIRKSFSAMLILNSSDALDKIRCESITDFDKTEAQPNFFIKIIPDKTNSTITIEDSGIGKDKERAREQSSDDRQIWYRGFHGGHECLRRHVHDWIVRRWVLFGVFGFGQCSFGQ